MPITNQMIRRNQVASGRLAIIPKEISAPRIGTAGTHGVLKGRWRFGRRTRSRQTPMQTITNASRVPMFTSSDRSLIVSTEAKKAAKQPTTIEVIHGVRKRGWMALAHLGSRPSLDIE